MATCVQYWKAANKGDSSGGGGARARSRGLSRSLSQSSTRRFPRVLAAGGRLPDRRWARCGRSKGTRDGRTSFARVNGAASPDQALQEFGRGQDRFDVLREDVRPPVSGRARDYPPTESALGNPCRLRACSTQREICFREDRSQACPRTAGNGAFLGCREAWSHVSDGTDRRCRSVPQTHEQVTSQGGTRFATYQGRPVASRTFLTIQPLAELSLVFHVNSVPHRTRQTNRCLRLGSPRHRRTKRTARATAPRPQSPR